MLEDCETLGRLAGGSPYPLLDCSISAIFNFGGQAGRLSLFDI